MSDTGQSIVLAVLVLSTSIWVGGYVAIAVVARAATATLDPADRVAFFRRLGRTYLWVGLPALVIALSTGGMLASDQEWGALMTAATTLAALLVGSLGVAVVQARRMTVLRRALMGSPGDDHLAGRVRQGARAAGVLRGVLGLLTVALVVLGAFLAT